jgi:predicted metal-dependent TIM-barrel fold hydrolase
MYFIDPHVHMISRVTDDYERMARMGCLAISEPAFWAGFDRGSAAGFRDYFHHLTGFEPTRAKWSGIQHYTWLCINAKEAENVSLSREVMSVIPEFIDKPNVLGIGEIGLNKNTRNEATIFAEQVDLAVRFGQSILIHTPHLRDKYKGTRMIVDMLLADTRVEPERTLIDHVEEHTVRLAKEEGFWCAMTLYPTTKCTPSRAADIIEMYGDERIMVNSAGDWGPSNPLAVPDFVQEMRRRGHPDSKIKKIVYDNPLEFFSQSKHFNFQPPDTLAARTNPVRDEEPVPVK